MMVVADVSKLHPVFTTDICILILFRNSIARAKFIFVLQGYGIILSYSRDSKSSNLLYGRGLIIYAKTWQQGKQKDPARHGVPSAKEKCSKRAMSYAFGLALSSRVGSANLKRIFGVL